MDSEQIILAGFFLLVGIAITVIGGWFSNFFLHKQKISYMKIEKRIVYAEKLTEKFELQITKLSDLLNELILKKDNKKERDKLCKNVDQIKELILPNNSLLYFKEDSFIQMAQEIKELLTHRNQFIIKVHEIEKSKEDIKSKLNELDEILNNYIRKSYDIQRSIKSLIK